MFDALRTYGNQAEQTAVLQVHKSMLSKLRKRYNTKTMYQTIHTVITTPFSSMVDGPPVRIQDDAEATTEKWGLEAGLFKVFTDKQDGGKSKGQQAKELLTRYGSAYLITSISFAVVSFALCYALINSGQSCTKQHCQKQRFCSPQASAVLAQFRYIRSCGTSTYTFCCNCSTSHHQRELTEEAFSSNLLVSNLSVATSWSATSWSATSWESISL